MSAYFAGLPKSITVDGMEIPINSDFRASIVFEEVMQDTRLTDEQRISGMLGAYFEESTLPAISRLCADEKAAELFQAVMHFYRCGAPEAPKTQKQERRAYSFSIDEKRIYAAFSEQYDIDLYEIKYLHWWKFSAMFSALSDTTEIAKIMHIRTAEFEKSMTAKERAALRRAKKIYALPDTRTEEQKDEDFASIFASGF